MGKVADSTAAGIRLAAHDDVTVEHLFTGYLRRKVGFKEPRSDIGLIGERDRLCSKTRHLVGEIPPQAAVAVERVLSGFLDNVGYHRSRSVASRGVKLSPWGEMFAKHIDASFDASVIKLSAEAYLYSLLDPQLDVRQNLNRLQGFGTALVQRVVLYKELVQDCVVAHDFEGRIGQLFAAKAAVTAGASEGDEVLSQVIAYNAHISAIVNANAEKP